MNRGKMLINPYHTNEWERIMTEKQQYKISLFVLCRLNDEVLTVDIGGA